MKATDAYEDPVHALTEEQKLPVNLDLQAADLAGDAERRRLAASLSASRRLSQARLAASGSSRLSRSRLAFKRRMRPAITKRVRPAGRRSPRPAAANTSSDFNWG